MQNEAQEYFTQYRIPEILDQVVIDLLKEKPLKPYSKIAFLFRVQKENLRKSKTLEGINEDRALDVLKDVSIERGTNHAN